MTKSNIMKKAWTLSKQASIKFGGKAKQYFSESLKMVWGLSKKSNRLNQSYVIKLTGTEKQIALATAIKEKFIETIKYVATNAKRYEITINSDNVINFFEKNTDASFWIGTKEFLSTSAAVSVFTFGNIIDEKGNIIHLCN